MTIKVGYTRKYTKLRNGACFANSKVERASEYEEWKQLYLYRLLKLIFLPKCHTPAAG